MHESGITVDRLIIDSLEPKHMREEIEDVDGFIDQGTVYGGRTMTGDFIAAPYDFYDRTFLQNEIFRIFETREPFYLIRDCEPGKRWLVKVDSKFTIETGVINKFSINFISNSPFSESVLRTIDGFSFDSDAMQVDMGLIGEDLRYIHNSTSFRIYNAGEITINPKKHLEYKITYKGASEYLTISNLTTNEKWSYEGASKADESIELKGIRSTKNNASIFGNTNRKLITLAPGWNAFQLTGTIGNFEISFDFRYRYLT